MPGINLVIGNNLLKYNASKLNDNFINNQIIANDYRLSQNSINKFNNDKIFFNDDQCIIVLDGVILNKYKFINKSSELSWPQIVWKLYCENGDEFFKVFNGSFSGVLYDKNKDKWIVFVDHIGSKSLYYYNDGSFNIVSSEISFLYEELNKYNIKNNLCVESAYMLLSYGYMLNNSTLSEKIYRLEPGCYILIEKNKFKVIHYYRLPLSNVEFKKINLPDIIEGLDYYFRKSIKAQFDKDLEYNYNHLVALSGGLDSRMTTWVSHEMGYENQINYTFSQSGYLDETIAKKIASDLKHEWIFKSLDNGTFLEDIDEINKISGGNVLYYGLAHGNSMLKLLNWDNFGVIHSGQLGDVVVGSFIKNLNKYSLTSLGGSYSNKLLSKISKINNIYSFSNHQELENALLYQRGLNGANNGLLASQCYSETISPFYQIEFFEYCLSIPLNIRMNHKLYIQWIINKYPKAGEYIWESSGLKANKKIIYINYNNKKIRLNQIIPLILYKIGLLKNSKNSMNPLDYWYDTNLNIKKFQDNFLYENINRIDNIELKNDCIQLYKFGNAIEKNQVLTLLSAIKLYFNN